MLKSLLGTPYDSEDIDTRLKTIFNGRVAEPEDGILAKKTEIVEINEILQKQIIFFVKQYFMK